MLNIHKETIDSIHHTRHLAKAFAKKNDRGMKFLAHSKRYTDISYEHEFSTNIDLDFML